MSTASVSACDKIDFAEINVKDMPLLGQVMICIQGEIYPKNRLHNQWYQRYFEQYLAL